MSEHSEHLNTRRKLRAIPTVSQFNALLDSCTLSEQDKTIIKLHYIQDKDFGYIADIMGFCEKTVKERHRNALKKLSKVI
jgi:DNA-directed RNA polymerase specialized sigma subunit